MATLVELNGVSPTSGDGVWLAPTAVLIGDVRIGDRATVWYGAVLRADFDYIEVGAESSIQDNAVLHCAEGVPTIVGSRVTVGHGALLAAGTVVPERATIAPSVLAAGVPAREKKPLGGSAGRWTNTAADDYQELRERYLST